MTKREVKNKIKSEKDTITLIQRYKKDFVDVLGKRGVHDLINEKLDNLNYLRKLLRKIEENEKK